VANISVALNVSVIGHRGARASGGISIAEAEMKKAWRNNQYQYENGHQ